MAYTEKEIIEICEKEMQNPSTFYQAEVINYRGRTSDTDELYNEIVAKYVCEHIKEFVGGIPKITRKTTYKTASHTGKRRPSDSRKEEQIAVDLFNQKHFDFIGDIIDYQTPLKNTQKDKAGKIDLLTFDGTTLRILELKEPDSKETMLRCVLEGYTYLKTVDKAKLLADFGLPADTDVKACPFVFCGGFQWQEMQQNRPYLNRLMELLNSRPYYVVEDHGTYTVTEE